MALPPPIPPDPDPRAWVQGSITLRRDDAGVLTGKVTVGEVEYWLRDWKPGAEKLHIVFECQPVSDAEFEAYRARLSHKASG